jgi:hypothetical protein
MQEIATITESYLGYEIMAVAVPLRDGGFTAHGHIRKDRGFGVDDIPFESGERQPTADSAVKAGMGWAKKRVDGTCK